MRKALSLFCVLACLVSLLSCDQGISNGFFTDQEENDSIPVCQRVAKKARALSQFLHAHPEYSDQIALLIDMRQHSGKNRLFVVDMKNCAILSKGLVAHGIGSETGIEDSLRFSNTPGSLCTSLGKYMIGEAYMGNFGRAYKLHGLEATNDNAYERFIVLHQYSCVPDEEQQDPICNSEGCTMVSENYFNTLENYIDRIARPIILEVFY